MHKLSALFLLLAVALPASAQKLEKLEVKIPDARRALLNADMVFTLDQKCNAAKSSCIKVLKGTGTIAPNSLDRLKAAAAAHPDVDIVYFDSPGGVLGTAMEMGQWLREHAMGTVIGGGTDPMVCLSACPFAMMGGVARLVEPGGIVGWHQYSPTGEGAAKLDRMDPAGQSVVIQLMAVTLSQYVEDMGVDPVVVTVAMGTDPSAMHGMTVAQARAVNLDNSDPDRSAWTLRANGLGGLAVVAEQRQPFSDGTALFFATWPTHKSKEALAAMSLTLPPKISAIERRQFDVGLKEAKICRGKTCVLAAVDSAWDKKPKQNVYSVVMAMPAKDIDRLVSASGPVMLELGTAAGTQMTFEFAEAGFTQNARALRAVWGRNEKVEP